MIRQKEAEAWLDIENAQQAEARDVRAMRACARTFQIKRTPGRGRYSRLVGARLRAGIGLSAAEYSETFFPAGTPCKS